MKISIWLHEGHDADPGVVALAPDLLGFTTWAENETEALARLPGKLDEYARWRARHDRPIAAGGLEADVAGRVTGNEILLPADREAATREEVSLAIELLRASRQDLWADLEAAPAGAFDWDPPYRRFAPWADWRTVRAILAHVANGETHYYTRSIGHRPAWDPALPDGDWRTFLPRSRAEAIGFLERLRDSGDLLRVRAVDHGFGEEWWSVRKALRRLVGHELCHAKSIRRILGEYRAPREGGCRRDAAP